MLIQAAESMSAGERYADAQVRNSGAWLGDAVWQEWLDAAYRVFYDQLLYSGGVTPIPVDTTFSYDPAVGHMAVASASARAVVDVFRVHGTNYEPLVSAQHTKQY